MYSSSDGTSIGSHGWSTWWVDSPSLGQGFAGSKKPAADLLMLSEKTSSRAGDSVLAQGDGAVGIRVENLSKCYRLYDKPQDRLRQIIYPRVQKMLGVPPKNYAREFWALKNVSFEVRRGGSVGIIGS